MPLWLKFAGDLVSIRYTAKRTDKEDGYTLDDMV